MFKLEDATNCYLFAQPGFLDWRISSDLTAKKSFLRSCSATQDCPAHPRNSFSTRSDLKGWLFNKADENARENWKKGNISIRCITHDDKWFLQTAMENSWDERNLEALVDYILPRLTESKLEEEMVRAAREGQWEKEKVQALLCQKSSEGTVIFSMLDFSIQQEVALWNPGATNKIAHLASLELIQWLISQANEGMWSKEDVGSILCRKNTDNQLILATLDAETQMQVAVFNKAKTCGAAPYMDTEFLQWLYQEAVEGRWDQSTVFKALKKEDVDGKTVIVAHLAKGKMLFESSTINIIT